MEENQFKLCLEILKRFHKAGILKDFVFIGSWCVYFYKDYFSDSSVNYQIPLTTRDIDILVNLPHKIRNDKDIPSLLEDLGYVVSYDSLSGYMKLDHPVAFWLEWD